MHLPDQYAWCAGADSFVSRIVAFICLQLCASFACAEGPRPLTIVYPRAESGDDQRQSYPLQLLKLALDHAGVAAVLAPSALPMQQNRALLELEHACGVDVVWTVTTRQREQQLLPVRIPIDRGLIGWRLLLTRQGDSRFQQVSSQAALRSLLSGQGHDWPDFEILKKNGFSVVGANTYEGLFHMLSRGHIDYFPRAIDEAQVEAANRASLGVVIEPSLVLHYPSALYFFVSPRNQALADLIGNGLESSIRDGSFQALWDATFKQSAQAAKLSQRRLIVLDNPDLPALTPLNRSELWFAPETEQLASSR